MPLRYKAVNMTDPAEVHQMYHDIAKCLEGMITFFGALTFETQEERNNGVKRVRDLAIEMNNLGENAVNYGEHTLALLTALKASIEVALKEHHEAMGDFENFLNQLFGPDFPKPKRRVQ